MRRLLCLALCAALLAPAAGALEPQGLGAEAPVSRGEFLLLLWQSAGAVPYDVTAHPFADLQDRDDLRQAAGWAYGLGLVKGTGEGQFSPDRALTREECAVLLRRWDKLWGRDTWLPDGTAACNDYEGISPWADDSLYWACVTGRLPWRDCRLAPLAPVTQTEAEGLFPPPQPAGPHFTSFSKFSQV